MRYAGFIIAFFLLTSCLFAARVDTVVIRSSKMNIDVKNVVITPASYKKRWKEFPVVYLLHGAYGCYSTWIRRVPEIAGYADQYSFIIVCPDGDRTSWYLDSPKDSSSCYETYVAGELVAYIDAHYRTKKDRTGRAITGCSMGGHGAFYLAIKHQDIWGAAGSISGLFALWTFPKEWELSKKLGRTKQDSAAWMQNSVYFMVDSLKDSALDLFFDCGFQDPFYPCNYALHIRLADLKINHEYIERPGDHSWDYWRESIKYHMQHFSRYFLKNAG